MLHGLYRVCVKCKRVYGCVYNGAKLKCVECPIDCRLRDKKIDDERAARHLKIKLAVYRVPIEMTGGICDKCP